MARIDITDILRGAAAGLGTFAEREQQRLLRGKEEEKQKRAETRAERGLELEELSLEQAADIARENRELQLQLEQERTQRSTLERQIAELGEAGIRVTDPGRLSTRVPTSPTTLPGPSGPIPFQMPTGQAPVRDFTTEAGTALGQARKTGAPVAGKGFIAAPREPNVNISDTGSRDRGVASLVNMYNSRRQDHINEQINQILRAADIAWEDLSSSEVATLQREFGQEFDETPGAKAFLQLMPENVRGLFADQDPGPADGAGAPPPAELTSDVIQEMRTYLQQGLLTEQEILDRFGEEGLRQIRGTP